MKRAIVLLLDSFGIGASLDAEKYGDTGSDTFGHIVEACFAGKANASGIRQGQLKIPNLISLGLAHAALASTGKRLSGIDYSQNISGAYGYAVEQSKGKDTPSGHWEIAGVPVFFDWGYFEEKVPCFPDELIQNLIQRAKLPGVLGNKHASGTDIIEELGAEHMRSGKPIIYTSADSVFQIAAHEESFGLQKLYDLCKISRELVDEYKIGRVIARPFVGTPGNFKRTANRKDLAVPPPEPTLLEQLISQKGSVIAIGKTADIFAHQGITAEIKADGNDDHFQKTLDALKHADDKSLIFTNFVDFDSKYGHRRDVVGYANALENLDAQLPTLFSQLREDDLVIITADHGCDPTWPGTDHTREHIPVIAFSPKISNQFIGRRDSFADIGQTIATHLGINALKYGNGFL